MRKNILPYADVIGVDKEEFRKAYREVTVMSEEQFYKVALALFTLANQLSKIAYQNVQQARFISEHKKAEEKIKSLSKFPSEDSNPVLRVRNSGVLMYINEAGSNLMSKKLGY